MVRAKAVSQAVSALRPYLRIGPSGVFEFNGKHTNYHYSRYYVNVS